MNFKKYISEDEEPERFVTHPIFGPTGATWNSNYVIDFKFSGYYIAVDRKRYKMTLHDKENGWHELNGKLQYAIYSLMKSKVERMGTSRQYTSNVWETAVRASYENYVNSLLPLWEADNQKNKEAVKAVFQKATGVKL